MPLPIDTKTILAARFSSVYAAAILSEALFFIVAATVDVIMGGFSFVTLICLILAMLISPAIAMFLGLVLAAVYAMLVRLAGRYAKIIQFAILFALLGGYFYAIVRLNSASADFEIDFDKLSNFSGTLLAIANMAYPFNFVGHIISGDVLYLLPYLAIFGVLFYLAFTLMGKNYLYVSYNAELDYAGKKLSQTELTSTLSTQTKKPMWLLIAKKDFALIFDQPQAALNVYSGLLGLLYILFIAFQNIALPKFYLPLLLSVVGAGISVFNTYASVSLNVEGQKFLLLRALPIRAQDILLGKSIPTMIVYLPLSICAVLAFGIIYQIDPATTLFAAIFNVAIIICSQEIGLIINIYRLRLDHETAVAAMKRSANTFIQFALSLILIIPYVVLCILQLSGASEVACLAGASVLYLLIALGLVWYLKNNAEKILTSYNY